MANIFRFGQNISKKSQKNALKNHAFSLLYVEEEYFRLQKFYINESFTKNHEEKNET